MSDTSIWSLQIGRWRGLHVRVHAALIIVAIFALVLSTSQPQFSDPWLGVLAAAILLVSVLAHELGHYGAAVCVGGSAEQIVLGPLGGLRYPDVPRESQPELITALAGPLVNLAVLLALLPMIVVSKLGVPTLVNPVAPEGLADGTWWQIALKLTFWINWVVLVANLLPAYPFDGGRMLRTLLWPSLDFRTAGLVVVRTSRLTALALVVFAWLLRDLPSAAVLPTWVPLALVATLIYFSAQQEAMRLEHAEWDEELLSYDFSQGYTSLERAAEPPQRPAGSFKRWLDGRREDRRRRQQWLEQEEERQVDDILLRLHESGMAGLSAKERDLLQRVSARYRNRQSN
jgi:Zn-dependent protease